MITLTIFFAVCAAVLTYWLACAAIAILELLFPVMLAIMALILVIKIF